MALLVPAVSKVREAAARTQSNNNLRQCAIAIHNYHGTFNRLPHAAATGGIYNNAGQEKTMWFQLLPFLEADIAYKTDNHDAIVPAYLAPSDPFIANENGKLNYAANIRLFGYETLGKDQANNAVAPGTGMPSGQSLKGALAPIMKSGLRLAEIKDGTANVFMLATRYADCGGQSTFYSASPTGTMLAGGAARAGKGGYFGAGSHDQPADRASVRAIYQVAPRPETCRADDSVFGHSFGVGGMSVALCDASIKSIDPNLTPATFCRALCPSDGFPLDNDWNLD
jgi:hypothetical protein